MKKNITDQEPSIMDIKGLPLRTFIFSQEDLARLDAKDITDIPYALLRYAALCNLMDANKAETERIQGIGTKAAAQRIKEIKRQNFIAIYELVELERRYPLFSLSALDHSYPAMLEKLVEKRVQEVHKRGDMECEVGAKPLNATPDLAAEQKRRTSGKPITLLLCNAELGHVGSIEALAYIFTGLLHAAMPGFLLGMFEYKEPGDYSNLIWRNQDLDETVRISFVGGGQVEFETYDGNFQQWSAHTFSDIEDAADYFHGLAVIGAKKLAMQKSSASLDKTR